MVFFEELQATAARNPHIRCHFTVTAPELEPWAGNIGRIDRDQVASLLNVGETATDPLYYVCGPRGFAEDIELMLGALGADRSRIRHEGW